MKPYTIIILLALFFGTMAARAQDTRALTPARLDTVLSPIVALGKLTEVPTKFKVARIFRGQLQQSGNDGLVQLQDGSLYSPFYNHIRIIGQQSKVHMVQVHFKSAYCIHVEELVKRMGKATRTLKGCESPYYPGAVEYDHPWGKVRIEHSPRQRSCIQNATFYYSK